jgi:hypothetical protein
MKLLSVLTAFTVLINLPIATVWAASPNNQATTTTGEWTSATGGSGVTGLHAPAGTTTLSWGTPVTPFGQSSYTFAGLDDPSVLFTDDDEIFTIGTFTHTNRTIALGTGISEAELAIRILFDPGFSAGSNPLATGTTVKHTETVNKCNQVVNPGCSDDIVQLLELVSNPQLVTVDGFNYEIKFFFSTLSIGDPGLFGDFGQTAFNITSPEDASSSVNIYGVVLGSNRIKEIPWQTDLATGAGALMLGGLVYSRYRKHKILA